MIFKKNKHEKIAKYIKKMGFNKFIFVAENENGSLALHSEGPGELSIALCEAAHRIILREFLNSIPIKEAQEFVAATLQHKAEIFQKELERCTQKAINSNDSKPEIH